MRTLAAFLVALAAALVPAHGAERKVLRVAFIIAETNFDPAFVSDLYSNTVVEEVFESPLTYDFLARPAKLRPQTLEAMPDISADGRTYTLRIKKGIYFADDPAFDGKKRELTARDYEYSFKRLMDPKNSSPNLWLIEGRIAGIEEAAAKAKKDGKFDYDAPIAGLEVVDRYTLRIRLLKADYNFLYILAMQNMGAMAREVVERYGADIGAHPVGTGAYRLAEWKRSSRIVLERNPDFREVYYEAEPPVDDPVSQQLHAEMKGKRIPQVDRVEISIIEESQPRWLAFLNKEIDWVNVPLDFINMALPGGKPAPWIDKRGMRYIPEIDPDITYMYWNMKDPVFGGYTPERIALRRAVSLAYNNEEEIHLLRNGMALEAQSPLPPGVVGYDARFQLGKTYDPAKAKALLDMFGYVDRNGDGWRDQPDGSPLVFMYATTPDQLSRQFTQLWKKNMDAIGIRMTFVNQPWPELLKQAKQGKLQMWRLGWFSQISDGESFLGLVYGKRIGQNNYSRFNLPEYNKLFEDAKKLPDGPQRTALYRKMSELIVAYAPWHMQLNRLNNTLVHPWVVGYKQHAFYEHNWRYLDLDLSKRKTGNGGN